MGSSAPEKMGAPMIDTAERLPEMDERRFALEKWWLTFEMGRDEKQNKRLKEKNAMTEWQQNLMKRRFELENM